MSSDAFTVIAPQRCGVRRIALQPGIVAFLILLCSAREGAAQAHCYTYESPGVELTGTLLRRVYPGPPNYESIKAGDRPDTLWVLRLDQSLCLNASQRFAATSQVREVQLLVNETNHRDMRRYLDRKTMFRGKLVGAELSRHHLPVVFWSQLIVVVVKDPDGLSEMEPAAIRRINQMDNLVR